jgi:putative tricarboxylic transport membrane protein
MIVASVFMLIVGRVGLTFFASVTKVPIRIIIPFIMVFCVVGTFLERDTVFSVFAMIALGTLGFVMQRYGYSVVTFLIGFVIGPLFELSLRQALIVTNHDIGQVIRHPIAMVFLIAALIAAAAFLRPKSGVPAAP